MLPLIGWLRSFLSQITSINKKYTHTLVFCAVFRDEAKILSEWITYHRNLGVDHFYLYNHKSEDDYQTVLKPYIDAQIVTLQDAPNEPWIHRSQWQREAYNHFLKNYGPICKWCCYCDLDEFVLPLKYDNLKELVHAYDRLRVGSLEITWQCFGTSYISKIADGELYTDKLVLKAKPDHRLHKWGKVIARPLAQIPWPTEFTIYRRLSIHHAILKPAYKEIPISLEEAQINHYITRDQCFYYEVRLKKRNYSEAVDTPGTPEEIEKEYNQVEDRKIQRFLLNPNFFE